MSTVATIKPHLNNITVPDALRNLQGWLVWRYEHVPNTPKPRKVPYYTGGGRRHGVQGRPEDRNQLTTFDAAKAAAARRGFDGVGLALMPEWGIVAGDFDDCVGDGGVHPDVERIITGTYAEYSPSGEGVRAFWLGNLGNNKSVGDGTFGFETFSSKGFVTFTGNRLDITDLLGVDNTIAELTDDVRTLHAQRFGKQPLASAEPDDPLMAYEPRLQLTDAQLEEALDVLDPDLPHDTWLHVGMSLHHETEGEGFALWDAWSAKGAKYPGEEQLRKRWDSFGTQPGRPVTARTLLKLAQENGAHLDPTLASAAEFDVITEAPAAPLRFQVIPAFEFMSHPPPSWIIKGVLPKAELVVLFGESGSGKSFVALDLAAAIARGRDWRGHRTRRGRVVYIAAEGAGGFRNRMVAYCMHNALEANALDDIGVIHAAPNFLQKADALDVAKAIKAHGSADVIVVDTFAQVTPGANENAAEDVGKALSHCRGIHRATGAVVVLVHHSGKDSSKGARGWSGIRGAADAQIEVLRTPGGRMLRLDKMKDGEDGREYGFDLQVVPIGMDEDGDVIDSCVVTDAPVPLRGKGGEQARKLGAWERLVVEVVGEISLAQNSGIEIDAVTEEVARRSPAPEKGTRDTRKQRARRALMALCEGDEAPYLLEDNCISVL
ncbi:AAA family ATPase [Ralstonia syzygii subsp. celebesensis]|uniref:AAA+ ATPase domain-containing protein n=2 Tax=Ralstonia syzygii subsp. celebesensis TaxID=1310168 RepID=A0A1U9VFM9_9RALS|nr:AAA family ATPase [Ralstonia syzygii]AQW29113.1 hypothetical protein B0B51_03185 [blood disease bacterium A2-HR MARDI]QQV54345.1 AAA family ATPase [Ralstonia syzygii subsp. celebesensis]CCA79403.1 hypothetical protein BDB_60010 [blood disease bacterium R229]